MEPEPFYHSPENFMENAEPVQSFVSPALDMGSEELARPRYGRPDRKPKPTPPQVPDQEPKSTQQ